MRALIDELPLDLLTEKIDAWINALVAIVPNAVVAVVVFVLFLLVSIAARWGVRASVRRLTGNVQIAGLLGSVASIALRVSGLFVALEIVALDKVVTSLLAGVGVVGLALGFAFQDIASNFMSGILMAFHRPFREGDQVELAGHLGRVQRIELRSTRLTTLDGLSVNLPNKLVYQAPIINYTETANRRMELAVGVQYDADLRAVESVCLEVGRAVKHRDPGREPSVAFESFGDSAINLTVRVWLQSSDQARFVEARSDGMIRLKQAFDEHGIAIPFPIRTLDFGAGAVGGEALSSQAMSIRSSTAAEA